MYECVYDDIYVCDHVLHVLALECMKNGVRKDLENFREVPRSSVIRAQA